MSGGGSLGGSFGSQPTYIENIDFLIGANPIECVLQIWESSQIFKLDYPAAQRSVAGITTGLVTITDPHFYAVLAVTAEIALSGTFDDFGAPGAVPYSGTYELPLWNAAQPGPDLINPSYIRFPCYKWNFLTDGNVVDCSNLLTRTGRPAGFNGFVNIYYAATSAQHGHKTPLQELCLEFESSAGNNAAVYVPIPGQQITYSMYAGIGSSEIDLGSSPAIPVVLPEVKGSFALFPPRGDAHFPDMIEDIIKSGQRQADAAISQIQRGLNCNEMPGPIQSNMYIALGGRPVVLPCRSPNFVGDALIAFGCFQYNAGAGASIGDTAGNAWTPIHAADNAGAWYATAVAANPGTEITIGDNGDAVDGAGFVLELDQGTTAFDNSNVATGTGAELEIDIDITVSGTPTFIVGFAFVPPVSGLVNPVTDIPAPWTQMFLASDFYENAVVFYRVVSNPGTYSISIPKDVSQPWWAVLMAFKAPQPVPYPVALGKIVDDDTMNVVRAQCQATGLMGSLNMNAQQDAGTWLEQIYQCANADPLWSGFVLKSIARSEVSAVGGGVVYTAPTAAGPVAVLTEDDFIGDRSQPLVTVKRKAQVNAYNIIQAQYFDRDDDYHPSTAAEPLAGASALFGPRKKSPDNLPMIQSPLVARKILTVAGNRYSMLRNVYAWKAKAKWLNLEARDLVEITESKIGIFDLAVRLTKITENNDASLSMEAEDFVYGCNDPNPIDIATVQDSTNPNFGGDPGTVNVPIIFEPPPRLLSQQNQAQIWAVVSGASPNYGGCVAFVSTDGGASYPTMLGAIGGNAAQGFTVGDWPAAADPDTTNDLSVDLTESLGTLQTFDPAERDAFFQSLCYVGGGGDPCIPYELMAYDIANLTGANLYTLPATGGGTNELRRSVFGAPLVGVGVDHPNGSDFAYLDPGGSGILKINMDPVWIGKTLYFKFLAVNTFFSNQQDLSDATPYAFTPTGCPTGTQNPNNNYVNTPTVDLSETTTTNVHMVQTSVQFPSNKVNYNARDFAIADPGGTPAVYYVTIQDTAQVGDTGALTNLPSFCELTTDKVGVPGYTYMGFIQVTNPTSDPRDVAGPGGWPPPQTFIVSP